ncbi:RecQ family ATP-dependent DNA helicase [Vulgatibacter sp.]|uniref:RecQ family ATP-dependent DNA helicase n=1 Tax=Vulgatibacter sp. TaxID=1971226 RepID=UPI00356A2BD7
MTALVVEEPPLMDLSPDGLRASLQQHFGFDGFRPGQEAVVRSVLEGRSTVAVMPTGAGKSLCYQLPALLLPGTALVVSPLVALMKDQVDSLQARGIPATFINSSIDDGEKARRLDGVRRGAFKLVYVAPERFRSGAFLDAIREVQLGLYAVDEAHCISQWGHDFRPDYTRLGQVRWVLRPPRTLALTATATPEVRDDIVRVLRLKDPQVSVAGFDRPNLFFEVAQVANEHEKLVRIARACKDGGGVVYCATRRDVEKVAGLLDERGVPALAYHAGMTDEERHRVQDAFMERDDAVVCATNAFGMGVDKPTIRFVAHFAVPKTMEAYYQEAGRAGRDGKPGRALLLFNHADVRLQERMIEGNHPSPKLLADLWERLGHLGGGELRLTERELASSIGASPIEVGSALKHLERAGHVVRTPRSLLVQDPGAELRVDFEGMSARRERELSMLRRMTNYAYHQGCRRAYLLAYFGDRGTSCSGCDVCSGPKDPPPPHELEQRRTRRRGGASSPIVDDGPYDGAVFEALREMRTTLAKAEGVPPYVVFNDRTLRAFARALPQTEEAFLAVAGAGPAKWERYGVHVLAAVAQAQGRSA